MKLRDLTRPAVEQAIDEFDRIGRQAFLAKYGFGPAREYFIVHNGGRYDSKAIAGAAHQFLGPGSAPLTAQSFSGGEQTVATKLRSLGFEVTAPDDQSPSRTIPFERGEVYNRRTDIHARYGGQERGGIATPSGMPFVFLFTGESGEQFGYRDGWRDDGSFAYTGEGQRGDMEFVRGNRAIRDHLSDGKDLLLFQATAHPGEHRFLGDFGCAGWETARAPDVDGTERDAIVFLLTPFELPGDEEEAPPTDLTEHSLEDLRRAAYEAAEETQRKTATGDARKSYYLRSAVVKAYVLRQANGVCESCSLPAPFLRKDGTPYLEPHHTKRLADGGPDSPRWVAAVCPTCHRRIHHGQDGATMNERVQDRLAVIEPLPLG